MIIIKTAKLDIVEREKLSLIYSNVQYVDWLSKEELHSIWIDHGEQTLSYGELSSMKATLDKISNNTKSGDTKKLAEDM
jgi:hypothetical protein